MIWPRDKWGASVEWSPFIFVEDWRKQQLFSRI